MDINISLDSNGIEFSEDEDPVTTRMNVAMEQVFLIPLIVENIIQEVKNLSDLKQCRLVNYTWKETTTKLMLKRNAAFVALRLYLRTLNFKKFNHSHMNDYYHPEIIWNFKEDEKDVEDTDDWTTLKKIIKKSTQFLCSTFVILTGSVSNPNLKNIFKVVGNSMKELKLIGVYGNSIELSELLGLNCSNLETLYIEIDQIEWSPKKISFELPKLKMLNIRCLNRDRESPFKILATLNLPNLEAIWGFSYSRDWEKVCKAGKIRCVKDLTFGLGENNDLPKLDLLVLCRPQLETLHLHVYLNRFHPDFDEKRKWMKNVQQLLDLSKDTLKSFSFYGIEGVFKNIHFPQFPRLQKIRIDSSSAIKSGEDVKYPYEILGNDICPNLQVIKGFDLSRDTQEIVRAEKIHCVKELCFNLGKFDIEDLRLFLSVRPQLESLQIYPISTLSAENLTKDYLNNGMKELTIVLEQLLELNKDTLTSFQFDGVGTILEDIKFPKFSKLQHLSITAGPVRMFPRGINLTETFPNLKILDLHCCWIFDNDEIWNKCFPSPDPFIGNLKSVKTLIVQRKFHNTVMRNLQINCPNAQLLYSDWSTTTVTRIR